MKKLLKILPVIVIGCFLFVSVMAKVGTDFTISGKEAETVTNIAANIWSTIIVIVRILAVAAVVFAGIRYMFASADQKADIKKSMGILVVGALLVFGATYLLTALGGASSTIFGQ